MDNVVTTVSYLAAGLCAVCLAAAALLVGVGRPAQSTPARPNNIEE